MKVRVRVIGSWLTALDFLLASAWMVSAAPVRAAASDGWLAEVQATNSPAVASNASSAIKFPILPMRTNVVALVPGKDDATIAELTANLLQKLHYRQQRMDDSMSSKFLDQYLDALDPSHLLFLQPDINEFNAYRTVLDDLTVKRGDTSPGDKIFNRYMVRIDQQASFVDAYLKTNQFAFNTDERYPLSRKTAPRPKDMAEAQQLWAARVRFEYLQEKLNDKKPAEINEIILRRYSRQQRYLREWDDSDVLQLYLTSLAHVYDPHSDYMGGPQMDNFNISMKLSLFGIGAVLQSEDGYCVIKDLSANGPAEKSGKLKPNDKIIAVSQGDAEPVDVVDMNLNKVVELIRGPKGTKVRLTIIPAHATDPSVRQTVTLVRDEIKIEAGEAKAKLIELPDAKQTRIGVVDLPSFYADFGTTRTNELKSTTVDLARLLKKLQQEKAAGIILDLRRNGGGSLEEAIRATGLFIAQGPVVQVKDWDGTITEDDDPDPSITYDGPLLVLTSRFSASASEILAGALQDYGRALIVGDISTHGKGTVQQLIPLDPIGKRYGLAFSGKPGALKITIRKFYLPNGASTQLNGVTPDIILPSVNNVADIGEKSLPNALAYDTIPSTKFQAVNRIQPYLAELKKRSASRVAGDQGFAVIRDEIARYEKTQAEKSVSLNEAVRRQEKQDDQARLDSLKQALHKRPESGEKVYDLTLKQVDLPGLPAPLAKTNTHLAVKTDPAAPAGGKESGKATTGTSQPGAVSAAATNAASTAMASSPHPGRIRVDALGDPDVRPDDDDLPDATLEEAKRILVDLVQLSTGADRAVVRVE